MNKIPVITIDGPSGSGKSTLSKIIAKKLSWFVLESGKIYRFIAYLALHKNIQILEKNIVPFAKNLDLSLIKKKHHFYTLINLNNISNVSSQLATYPKLRKILLTKQRLLKRFPGLIAEGRDMGTVVFPDAVLKFFLSARLDIRVKRRMLELKQNNNFINFKELFKHMQNRDQRDQNRLISPLCKPKNAIILDSTYMNLSEVVTIVMEYIMKNINIQSRY